MAFTRPGLLVAAEACSADPVRRQDDPMSDAVDPRNRLNDLSNREWLKETKSFWLSQAPPRSALKAQHPATFSERDVARLICLFTKRGARVLDPFVGSGSTLIACAGHGRIGVGIELSPKWATIARGRLLEEAGLEDTNQVLIEADTREALPKLEPESLDLLLTSPPYWSMLRKKPGLKAQAERLAHGLPTHYSESPDDLGNIEDYDEFLEALGGVFSLAFPALKPAAYACVVVSDFRHRKRFVMHHADVGRLMEAAGYVLKGITVLAQDNKNLYPFGIPYHFVSNIHHQYILIHQKPDEGTRAEG
jgi:DNA modification methylase